MEPIPVQGQPGVLVTPDGKQYQVGDARKQVLYDELVITSGLMVANTEFKFVDNLSNKKGLSTNLGTNRRIPAGKVFRIERVGVNINQTYGNTDGVARDIKKCIENAFFEFKVNSILVSEGPVLHFPGGYGVYGNTTEAGLGVVTNGIPSEASILGILDPIVINSDYELFPKLVFNDRVYDASSTMSNLVNRLYARFEMMGTLFTAATL